MTLRCLIVEDVPAHRDHFVDVLTHMGHEVVAAWSDQDYADHPECQVRVDLILLDDKFGTAKTGADLIQVLRVDHPTAIIASISGSPVSYADHWVGKGVDRETLADLCKTAAVRRGQSVVGLGIA